jgi:uncharacterized protein YjdB
MEALHMLRRWIASLAVLVILVACANGSGSAPPLLQPVEFGPPDGATNVRLDATVFARFDRPFDWMSLEPRFLLTADDGVAVAGQLAPDPDTLQYAEFTAFEPFLPETTYTATLFAPITGPGGARMAESVSWSFTTVPLVSVSIPGGDRSVVVGGTVQVNAVVSVTGGAATSVTWSSSDTNTATVSGSGLVTGISAGTSTITATSTFDATKQASIVVTVTTEAVEPAVLDVQIDQGDFNVQVGATVELSATVSVVGGAAQTVTWSSSDEAVATVDTSGVVSGVIAGQATITATSTFDPSRSASVVATVTPAAPPPAVVSVSIVGGDRSVALGGTVQLEAEVTVVGGAATTVAWQSSDPLKATVDAAGVVRAVAVGTTQVRATSTVDATKFDEITITVTAPPGAVAFVGARSASTPEAATILTIPLPTGVAEGDVLIAHITSAGRAFTVSADGWTTPTGGTESSYGSGGNPVTQVILTSAAGANPPSAAEFTVSGDPRALSGGIIAFRYADVPITFASTPAPSNTTSTAIAPSVEAGAGSMLVTLFATTTVGFVGGQPIGMDVRYSEVHVDVDGPRARGATEARGAGGPTGTRSVALTANRRWVAHSVVVPFRAP